MRTVRPGIRRETISTFLSDREFQPQISQIEFNYATNRTSYIYAMALRKDVKHPFPPESDEVTIAKPDESPEAEGNSARRGAEAAGKRHQQRSEEGAGRGAKRLRRSAHADTGSGRSQTRSAAPNRRQP